MPEIVVRIGDITQIATEAIVNSANPSLFAGGGVSGAIHRAAGADLQRACREIGPIQVGHAVVTPAFLLPAKWVIHAVGPQWRDGNSGEASLLEACYRSICSAAESRGIAHITVPSISTGIYRFPLEPAARIAIDTMQTAGTKLSSVTFVGFDETTASAYETAIKSAR